MTIAEKIAGQLNDDGQCWETTDGMSFSDLAMYHGARVEWRDGHRTGDVVRYTFPDKSVLVEAGDGWDFGFEDCWCWQAAGHSEGCTR